MGITKVDFKYAAAERPSNPQPQGQIVRFSRQPKQQPQPTLPPAVVAAMAA